MILSYADIDRQCTEAIHNVTKYNIKLDVLLQTLYNTGLRLNEVYELNRWSRVSDTIMRVNLEKGNGTRDILTDYLPTDFVWMVDNKDTARWLYTVRQVRYLTKCNSPYKRVTAGRKEVVAHLYRYRMAKYLTIMGYTATQVKEYLHHKSLNVTLGYINGDIHGIDGE